MNVLYYILTMAVVTYLIRVIPLVLIKKKIGNRFVQSFLYYVPYTCLSAMTVPAVFYATQSILSAAVGFVVAFLVALKEKSLVVVASVACIAVFIVELLLQIF